MAGSIIFRHVLRTFVLASPQRFSTLLYNYGCKICCSPNLQYLKHQHQVAVHISSSSNTATTEGSPVSESHNTHTPDEGMDGLDLKLKILEASIQYVPEHGWTKTSIAMGAKSIGLSPAAQGLVQSGAADLVHYFTYKCNQELEAYLQKKVLTSREEWELRDYITDAMKMRLKMTTPFAAHWPKAVALMLSPSEVSTSLKNLLDMVNIIWTSSGDRSVYMTWYSKRFSLAVAYRLSELSMIQDKSPDFADTFAFLERRVNTAMETDVSIDEVNQCFKQLPEIGIGLLQTARNVVGANQWFR